MRRIAIVSALCALFLANTLAVANAQEIEPLSDRCSSGDPNACVELLKAIVVETDQSALAKIAVENKYWKARLLAVGNLKDQAPLAKVAVKDKEPSVRCEAVKKLTDKALLAKIAAEDKTSSVRDAAKRRLAQIRNKMK